MTLNKTIAALFIMLCALIYAPAAHAVQPTEDFPIVKLQSLDKTTARTQTFEARVGSTVKFGPLFIKVQACRKTSPIETPESAAFLQIWELSQDQSPEWVFSGWMFASSPGLSSMDHPIYDVWVLDCLETKKDADDTAKEEKLGVKTDDGEVKEAPAMPPATDMTSPPPTAAAPASPEATPASSAPAVETPAPETEAAPIPEDSEAEGDDETPAAQPAPVPTPTTPAPVTAAPEKPAETTPAYDEGVY